MVISPTADIIWFWNYDCDTLFDWQWST